MIFIAAKFHVQPASWRSNRANTNSVNPLRQKTHTVLRTIDKGR